MRLHVIALVATSSVFGLLSCGLIVRASLGEVFCKQEGVVGHPACAMGDLCYGGRCVPCATSEVCGDSIDNDCDLSVDDGCESEQLDAQAPQDVSEVTDTATSSDDAGPEAGPSVDAEVGLDVRADDGPPSPLGRSCERASDCGGDYFCANIVGKAGVCTKPCCTSTKCPVGSVCMASMGANLCALPAMAKVSQPGNGDVGASCSSGGNCRSGRCTGGVCVDVCCDRLDCEGHACASSLPSWQCAGHYPGTRGEYGKACESNDQCDSNLCLPFFTWPLIGSYCTGSCCSTADCPVMNLTQMACAYRLVGNTPVRGCLSLQNPEGKTLGSACAANEDCKSNFCLAHGQQKYCSDACCRNTDCGGLFCLPNQESMSTVFGDVQTTVLRCMKP